jgi:hypothetical protein
MRGVYQGFFSQNPGLTSRLAKMRPVNCMQQQQQQQ